MTKVAHEVVSCEIKIVAPGTFENVLGIALELAKTMDPSATVSFDYDGRTFSVNHDSDADLMVRHFRRPRSTTADIIGSYPDPEVTDVDRMITHEREHLLPTILTER